MTIGEYAAKMKGGARRPPGPGLGEVLWTFIGVVTGIGTCTFLSAVFFEPRDMTLLVASFGASASLAYGAVKSPFSQPRNLIGGHVISALIGVFCHHLLAPSLWAAAILAVALAAVAMMVTGTFHPPGGATALLAVIGGPQIQSLGYLYPFIPVGLGAAVLVAVAVLVNNLCPHRRYPEYWL